MLGSQEISSWLDTGNLDHEWAFAQTGAADSSVPDKVVQKQNVKMNKEQMKS